MTEENKFTSLSRTALSDAGDGTYTIHGTAIGEDDVTLGSSGTKKVWRREPLEGAVESLEGQPIVVDHENTSHSVVGKVTSTKYEEGVGILYEGEIHDEELAEKISNGLLEVSLRGHHEDSEEMSVDEDTGAREPMNVVFDNLSIVPSGAAPSNTVDTGEHEELAVAELAQYFEEQEDDEPEEPKFSEGDYVSWGDGEVTGIVRSVNTERKQVTVQVHTEDDDAGEASGQEISEVGFDQLSSVEELEAGKPDAASEPANLQEYQIHEIEYSGTTESDWSEPNLEDFTDESWEDLSQEKKSSISDHYFMAEGGFPPEEFSDLKLPAVEPNGDLNLSALRTIKGGHGVQSVDGVTKDEVQEVVSMVNRLARDEFDAGWGDEGGTSKEDMSSESEDEEEMSGDNNEAEGSEGREESTEELEDSDARELEATTAFENGLYYTTMTEDNDFDNPVKIEKEELESLREENEELSQKEETVEELNETLSELRDNQEILDEVDGDALEQLRETENPVVLSEERHEELSSEVEQVKEEYASELSEEMPAFDEEELARKFDIDELAEKVDSLEDADEEELSDDEPDSASESEELEPDPQSKDKQETEELEETEELSEDEAKKEEMLSSIGSGWGEYAE